MVTETDPYGFGQFAVPVNATQEQRQQADQALLAHLHKLSTQLGGSKAAQMVGPGKIPTWDDYGKSGELPSDTLGDIGTSLKQGVARIPGDLTGIADIPAGLVGLNRPFSRIADWAGGKTGFQPGQWADNLDADMSPQAQYERQAVNQAWEDPNAGISSVAKAYVQNPRAILGTVTEAVPETLAGGVLTRSVAALLPKLSPYIAAGLGEGAIAGGNTMANIDQHVDPQRAATASLADGVATGIIGGGGGKLAHQLGVSNLGTWATGRQEASNVKRGLPSRLLGGAAVEAAEEAPQSAGDVMAQNYAEKRPLMQGAGRGAVEGALAGALMGGAVNLFTKSRATPQSEPPPPPAPEGDQTAQGEATPEQDVPPSNEVHVNPNAPPATPAQQAQAQADAASAQVAPPLTGAQLTAAQINHGMGQMAAGFDEAATNELAKHILAGDFSRTTFRNPAAVQAAKANPNYNTIDNGDGSVTVFRVKTKKGWVGNLQQQTNPAQVPRPAPAAGPLVNAVNQVHPSVLPTPTSAPTSESAMAPGIALSPAQPLGTFAQTPALVTLADIHAAAKRLTDTTLNGTIYNNKPPQMKGADGKPMPMNRWIPLQFAQGHVLEGNTLAGVDLGKPANARMKYATEYQKNLGHLYELSAMAPGIALRPASMPMANTAQPGQTTTTNGESTHEQEILREQPQGQNRGQEWTGQNAAATETETTRSPSQEEGVTNAQREQENHQQVAGQGAKTPHVGDSWQGEHGQRRIERVEDGCAYISTNNGETLDVSPVVEVARLRQEDEAKARNKFLSNKGFTPSAAFSDALIRRSDGQPFPTERQAQIALRNRKQTLNPDEHHIVPVEGGFAIAPKQAQAPVSKKEESGKSPHGHVSEISSSEIGADINDRKSLKVKVLEKLRAYFQGHPAVVTSRDGDKIIVAWNGIKHAMNAGLPTWQEAAAALHIEELIADASVVAVTPDKHGRLDPKSTTTYQTMAKFDGVSHTVSIFVRNHSDGNRYYDHVAIENKDPAGLTGSMAPTLPFTGSKKGGFAASDGSIRQSDEKTSVTGHKNDVASQADNNANTYGKSNKIFTEDAAQKARETLRKKLGQLNSGIDPEILQAGLVLAGYHIEAGAAKYAAYAKAMTADLGDAVRPYLRSFYEAVRHYPGFDNAGMSSGSELDASEKYGIHPGEMWRFREEPAREVDSVNDGHIHFTTKGGDGKYDVPTLNFNQGKRSGDWKRVENNPSPEPENYVKNPPQTTETAHAGTKTFTSR